MATFDNNAVAVLTATLLLLCDNVRPIKAQSLGVDCNNYPCFEGGICIMESSAVAPFCTISCHSSTCGNGGTCTNNFCHCPVYAAAPTCEARFAAYLTPLEMSVREGSAVNGMVEIHVNVCRQPSNFAMTVAVLTSQDSAEESSDYVPIDTSVTIPFGDYCQPVNIQIVSDTIVEPAEKFHLSISSRNIDSSIAYIIDGHMSATITIINDDDINECSGDNTCDPTDTCVNTFGSYRCECRAGYTGGPYFPSQQSTCTGYVDDLLEEIVKSAEQDNDPAGDAPVLPPSLSSSFQRSSLEDALLRQTSRFSTNDGASTSGSFQEDTDT